MFVNRNVQNGTRVLHVWMVVALVVGMLLVTASSPEALAKPVTDGFNPVVNNTAPTIGELAVNMVYLPLMMKNFPFVPGAPVLNAISNTDGDGNYTVDWSSSDGADMYILQEDDNAVFSSPTAVYSGSNTSTAISGRNVGMYYYRSQASNTYASSGWSNIEPVTVTVPPRRARRRETGLDPQTTIIRSVLPWRARPSAACRLTLSQSQFLTLVAIPL
jgi:hypothetical protein